LLRRPLDRVRQVDFTAVFAPLIRQQMGQGNPQQALELLTQARDLGSEQNRRSFDTWRAEILALTNKVEQAGRIYRDLIASAPAESAPRVALDAAETLLDNGHGHEAKRLLAQALDLARATHMPWVENHARALLESCS
jgi:predicted Zn-dependent protease